MTTQPEPMTPQLRCLTLIANLLLLAGHATAIAEDRHLRVAINTDIRSNNPGVARDANTDTVIHHIVESLVGYGADLRVRPVLADSISVSDDGLIYRFHIRPGVRFHNGEPLTAAEVLWNWQRFLDPETKWQCRRWYSADSEEPGKSVIVDVRAPQPDTVEFELAEPSVLFLDRLANVQCPAAIVHPDSVDANGEWRLPVGTGPFEFSEWKRGQYVELRRFADYHTPEGTPDGFAGAKPVYADSLRFIVSPDHASTKAALLGDGIDLYPGVPMNSLAELKAEKDIALSESPLLGWTALLVQTEDSLLSDPRMRRAIAHAIDREQIVGFNTYGHASPNSSAVPVGDPAHDAAHDAWYEPSREKARALLREAGYAGEIIEIQTNRKYSNMYDNAVVIQAMLHSVGINARLQVLDWASQLANYYAGKFQVSAFSFSALANPTMRYAKLIGPKDRRATYQWDSERANELLAELLAADDPEHSNTIYRQLHEVMRDEVPIIGLYNAHSVTAMRADVSGYDSWPMGLSRLWGVYRPGWRGDNH